MFEVVGINQRNPFSSQLLVLPNIVWDLFVPTPNVTGGASRVSICFFASMAGGGGAQDAYFKVYDRQSPDPLVDGPDIVLPFQAGVDPVFMGFIPGVVMREGDANGLSDGAYFGAVSVFASLNPGTDESENPITAGPCVVGLLGAPAQ